MGEPISHKSLLRIAEVKEILQEMMPKYSVEIHSTEQGWKLVVSDNMGIGYQTRLTNQALEHTPAYGLAELIYDKIAMAYTD